MAEPRRALLGRIAGPFVAGLLFLAPVILTIVLLQWVATYVVAALGPRTFIGRFLASSGMLVTESAALAFWAGLGAAAVLVWALGLLVQTQARARLEGGLDNLVGRVPLIGGFYRPLAQMVRMIGPAPGGAVGGELQGLAVINIRLAGEIEVLGLLASPEVFDLGDGPRYLVIVPTAPVPVGGNMLFVEPGRVRRVPGLRVDDLAKLYVSMGAVMPAGLGRA